MLCIAPAEVDLLRAGIGFQAVAFGIDYERRVVVLAVVGAQARLAVVLAAVLERSGVERVDISALGPLEAEMQSRFGVGRHRMLHCQDHEYELYLAVENIDHTRTKVKSPQTNGIVERFHKTVLNEFYRVAFRRKIYSGIEQLQADLDAWLREYNELRPHQGRWCYGKTPMQTFRDSVPLAKEKMLGSTTASAAAESLGL